LEKKSSRRGSVARLTTKRQTNLAFSSHYSFWVTNLLLKCVLKPIPYFIATPFLSSRRNPCQIWRVSNFSSFRIPLQRQHVEPHGLKPVCPPHASEGRTLRSIPYYAPSELRRVPSPHSSSDAIPRSERPCLHAEVPSCRQTGVMARRCGFVRRRVNKLTTNIYFSQSSDLTGLSLSFRNSLIYRGLDELSAEPGVAL